MSLGRNSSQSEAYTLLFIVDSATMTVCIYVLYTVVCQGINVFGIVTNIINIVCFVKQGFKDSINVSLLGMNLKHIHIVA